jgi:hypothetical protein
MPRDMKDAVTSRVPRVGSITFGKTDDQLLWLDFDPDHVGVDKATVVNRFRRFEMFANRAYDQSLDLGRRHPGYGSGALGIAVEQGRRKIVSVLDAALAGVARAHPIAAVILVHAVYPNSDSLSDFSRARR